MSGRSLRLSSSERLKSRPCSHRLLGGRASSLCSRERECEGGRWVRWCTQPEGRWNLELKGHPPARRSRQKWHQTKLLCRHVMLFCATSFPMLYHFRSCCAEHVREWVGMGGACEGVGGDVRDLLVPEPGIMQVACRPTAGTAWIP